MSKLILVPTPIGNLEDITLRAIRCLKEAQLVLSEDTRKTGLLLKHLGISTKQMAYHQNNEHKILDSLVDRINELEKVALVTDAGTPGISDPGFLLVRACLSRGIEIECLPGPTALIPALVNSGLPSDHFTFEGFLPPKKGRQSRLTALSTHPYTLVFYEAPHRLLKTLDDLALHLGADRQACVCRELTKVFEENVRGDIASLINHFTAKAVKGEIVIVVEGYKPNKSSS